MGLWFPKDSYLIHNEDCPSIKHKECVSKSKEPLVSSDFMMYSFDDICRDVETIDIVICHYMGCIWIKREKSHISQSTREWIDRNSKRGELQDILYNMNKDSECYDKYYERLQWVYNSYGDELAFKLRLKPFETLDLALPNVYKDYCNKNKISDEDKLDLSDFLSSVKKVYIVVAISDKRNPAADRAGSYRFILRKPFDRLRELGLFDMVEIMDHNEFKFFLERIWIILIFYELIK